MKIDSVEGGGKPLNIIDEIIGDLVDPEPTFTVAISRDKVLTFRNEQNAVALREARRDVADFFDVFQAQSLTYEPYVPYRGLSRDVLGHCKLLAWLSEDGLTEVDFMKLAKSGGVLFNAVVTQVDEALAGVRYQIEQQRVLRAKKNSAETLGEDQ